MSVRRGVGSSPPRTPQARRPHSVQSITPFPDQTAPSERRRRQSEQQLLRTTTSTVQSTPAPTNTMLTTLNTVRESTRSSCVIHAPPPTRTPPTHGFVRAAPPRTAEWSEGGRRDETRRGEMETRRDETRRDETTHTGGQDDARAADEEINSRARSHKATTKRSHPRGGCDRDETRAHEAAASSPKQRLCRARAGAAPGAPRRRRRQRFRGARETATATATSVPPPAARRLRRAAAARVPLLSVANACVSRSKASARDVARFLRRLSAAVNKDATSWSGVAPRETNKGGNKTARFDLALEEAAQPQHACRAEQRERAGRGRGDGAAGGAGERDERQEAREVGEHRRHEQEARPEPRGQPARAVLRRGTRIPPNPARSDNTR